MKRAVLVTGATGDIGRAIALRFASEGWSVLGQYASARAEARKLESEIIALGGSIHWIQADFLSETSVKKFLIQCQRYKIDTLVNNAGSYVEKKHFSKLNFKNLRDTFMLNAFVPIVLTSQIFERMKKQGEGRIVNISSIAGKYGGSAHSMHYGAAKRALEGMTRTLAREGAPYNIYVNTVRPGMIDTNIHKLFPKNLRKRIQLIPLKRMGQPEDIAETVYHLGSEKNNYITNQTITVAGGE